MNLNHRVKILTISLMLITTPLFASPIQYHEQLQVPLCLAKKIKAPHEVLAENNQFQIIDLSTNDVESITRLAEEVKCGHYMNVTHKLTGNLSPQELLRLKPLKTPQFFTAISEPYVVKHHNEVNTALKQINADNIWQTLTQMTAFPNRSATKDNGLAAAYWLKKSFDSLVTASGRADTTSFFVSTGNYRQPSLVTVLGTNLKAPAIVIGAHMDTLDGIMPGAGDDGSGSAGTMEMARVLLASDLPLKRPVYIIWYAAEERGLVGSQFVVQYFKKYKIPVKAVLQFDMTGYRVDPTDPTMWVFTDYTNKSLNQFIAQLITTYIQVPVAYSQCGYGRSDHASWNQEGIPASFPCESNSEDHNPYIHTSSDTMDLLNLEHMTNFSKLATAFALELALD